MGLFRMPSLGADMEAGTLVEWLVKPGDTVHRGDVVAVVETQKGAIEIEVFETGRVDRLIADLGTELPVGAPLAVILAEGEAPPEDVAETPVEPLEETPAAPEPERAVAPSVASQPAKALAAGAHMVSPAARVRAHELGIDLASVTGTGPGGVVVLADVEGATSPVASLPKPAESPMAAMRAAIAAAMTRSKRTIPHFYLTHTLDIQHAADWLAQRNADAPPADRVLMGALFVRAAALAAAEVKELNGHYLEDGFHPADKVNPGVAVALRGGGLVAPALMDAPAMTLADTMAGMRDLVMRARAGRLKGSEMTEGTLTVSAIGDSGPEMMTGVIFPPQVALVGLGAPQIRAWVVDGAVVPRTVVTISLSADHRVADGRTASRFVTAFETIMHAPEEL